MISVVVSENFEKDAKRLIKKYRSLAWEIKSLITALSNNPLMGTPIGKDCYKIRLAIKSKGRGKSGGARVITLVLTSRESVVLLSIYDKSEKDNIGEEELVRLLSEI